MPTKPLLRSLARTLAVIKEMQNLYLFILAFGLLCCNNTSSEQNETNSEKVIPEIMSLDTLKDISTANESESEMDILTDGELMAKWTWGEGSEIVTPERSSINNFPFSSEIFLNKWKYSEDEKPILEFTSDSMDVFYTKYIYTINQDSIRIFTKADHPGGGIDRGIITKLTKDSLLIEWSTDDRSVYVRYNE